MAKKDKTQNLESMTEAPLAAETPEEREIRSRRKETRPANVVFSEKAGNRLRLFEYQLDALVQQCRGRVARPTQEQFQWLQQWLREHVEAAITAISVELAKEASATSGPRENVPVPI